MNGHLFNLDMSFALLMCSKLEPQWTATFFIWIAFMSGAVTDKESEAWTDPFTASLELRRLSSSGITR